MEEDMTESNIYDCKKLGTCWKVISYFNGDNRFMCCCDDCEDFEMDDES